MDIRVLPYEHPDAVKLLAEAQLELAARYGSEDVTPMDAAQFAAPRGLFLTAYLDDVPVACGAWRSHDSPEPLVPGDAEIKRMYVTASARGRGLARAILADLERTAAEAGRRRMVLETGDKQPEAIALYESAGYREMPGFGYYKDEPESIYYAKSLV
ncbi:GNAT family N-acetyltransferase [Amycolatopsis regifaucium]|uniref:Acetyltransferase n=1 Tax=Amycolatopsis regifaucium TaxID=546365 RepID=A0A154MCM8_9PSEU|nr:GNAT family N-acetyltransferase [Amycolatopsis regifaucium]KZB81439.1 acetyltransferase [Amycolatopsis regifaucium]OKA04703.1 GNAT family N-acetyltransferase [Amycolatopsis regifaucium]SFH31329.1 Acetyltransferase (GNAT) family protein [Amycolatopsis regifaucium]